MKKQVKVISREGRLQKAELIECTKCHRFLAKIHFKKCNKVTCGLDPNCNECHRKRGVMYRAKPDATHKAKIRHDIWYAKNRKTRLSAMKLYLVEVREMVIVGYGGACECCGETKREFLCIDHRNGDGKADRERGLMGRAMYLHLIRNKYPRDRYRLLCHNCNMSHGLYGYCPHQRSRIETEAV